MPRRRTNDLWGGRSPWVSIYEARYESQHYDSWNNERVYRLCRLVGCQTEDLCAYAGEFSKAAVSRHLKQNRWPVPLVLHFVKLERFVSGLRSPDMQDITTAQLMARGSQESQEQRAHHD